MGIYEINLKGDINVMKMDLMDALFLKEDEEILNDDISLDICFLFWIYKSFAKIWKDK